MIRRKSRNWHLRDFMGVVENPFARWYAPAAAAVASLARLMRGETVTDLELMVRIPATGGEFILNYNGSLVPYERGKRLIFIQFQDVSRCHSTSPGAKVRSPWPCAEMLERTYRYYNKRR